MSDEHYPAVREFFDDMDNYDRQEMADLLESKGYCVSLSGVSGSRETDLSHLLKSVMDNAQFITDDDLKMLRVMSNKSVSNPSGL
jgi:hypothetical protein